jgi:hypothetical protein
MSIEFTDRLSVYCGGRIPPASVWWILRTKYAPLCFQVLIELFGIIENYLNVSIHLYMECLLSPVIDVSLTVVGIGQSSTR